MTIIHSKLASLSFIGVAIIILAVTIFSQQQRQEVREHAAGGFLHVVGTELIDENGNPLLLRGAMVESPLAYITGYQAGNDPLAVLSLARFQAMSSWKMNVVRINMSYWIYLTDKTRYLSRLDTAVQNANQAGLYVVLDFHDDFKSGSPYGDMMMHQEHITWWTLLANQYKNNPKVLFDLENEPKYTDWNTWANGNNTGIVGYNQVITAIRQTGAQNIIVLEPGTAAGKGAGWTGYPENISDKNIIFSKHDYDSIISGNPTSWNQEWGPVLGKHALFYGEWAILPNPLQNAKCTGLTSQNADGITNAFLAYMESIHANWTAWEFASNPVHLVKDSTAFTPSTFDVGTPWTCGDTTSATLGMGTDVKNFLSTTLSGAPTNTPTQSVTSTSSPTVTLTPTLTPGAGTTVFTLTLCPHELGNCGDNVSPNAGGNTSPQHSSRDVTVYVYNSNNQLIAAAQGTVLYNQTAQNFQGTVTASTIPAGQYLVTVKMDQFLSKQIPGIVTIISGQQAVLPMVSLVTGDINNDNQLDLQDYNALIGCFGSQQTNPNYNCLFPSTATSPGADINDDGTVSGSDYNEFLREISVQHG